MTSHIRIPLLLLREEDKPKVAKCQNKTKGSVSSKRKAYGWKTSSLSRFQGWDDSTKSFISLSTGVKWRFFAKKLKKSKKVLDKPARILYSSAVKKNCNP
jgi:hypothetical protein